MELGTHIFMAFDLFWITNKSVYRYFYRLYENIGFTVMVLKCRTEAIFNSMNIATILLGINKVSTSTFNSCDLFLIIPVAIICLITLIIKKQRKPQKKINRINVKKYILTLFTKVLCI